jgi:hypothetical protein
MANAPADLTHALALINQAYNATADAASLLRDFPQYDELACTAMRLEAELVALAVHLERAGSTTQLSVPVH